MKKTLLITSILMCFVASANEGSSSLDGKSGDGLSRQLNRVTKQILSERDSSLRRQLFEKQEAIAGELQTVINNESNYTPPEKKSIQCGPESDFSDQLQCARTQLAKETDPAIRQQLELKIDILAVKIQNQIDEAYRKTH